MKRERRKRNLKGLTVISLFLFAIYGINETNRRAKRRRKNPDQRKVYNKKFVLTGVLLPKATDKQRSVITLCSYLFNAPFLVVNVAFQKIDF